MTEQKYSKSNPFKASIKERYSLCKQGSKKNTQHIVIDLKDSGISYEVGDCIAIFPQNDPIVTQQTLQAMKATGQETVYFRQEDQAWNLFDFLTSKANITEINRKLFSEITLRQTNPQKKTLLEMLQTPDQKESYKEYIGSRYVWDLLIENHEVSFSAQELCSFLMPLLPRFYSIASSRNAVGDEVHLTVALLQYHSNGHPRVGVCTHYLCNLAPMHEPVIQTYIQPHKGFTVPTNPDTPMIMIGPGTGIAPFRAFMQERMIHETSGDHWLFFGEWNRATDFLYEGMWQDLVDKRKLRLDVAFSRDQDHKIYVQHRMHESGEELFHWIENGAYLYVCGDAQNMAKDVEAALGQIIQVHGKRDEQQARQYIKQLRADKRYLRDVY